MKENDVQEVARHMGHELAVHRKFYRLQDDVIELAKISKLLIAVENGRTHHFKGMSLDDLDLKDFPEEEIEVNVSDASEVNHLSFTDDMSAVPGTSGENEVGTTETGENHEISDDQNAMGDAVEVTDGNSNLSGVTTEPGKMRECEGANHFGAGQADHHDSDSESDSDLEWVAGIKKRKRSTGQKKKWTEEERQLISCQFCKGSLMKVHYPKLYNMAHLLASNVLLLPKDLTIIFIPLL